MESPLLNKSLEFATQIVLFYEVYAKSKRDTTIAKQLLRSATSVGANIREAFYAHSKADFVSKLQIALKECYETEYWIELLIDGGYYNNKEIQEKCVEIKKILISSINTAKENMK